MPKKYNQAEAVQKQTFENPQPANDSHYHETAPYNSFEHAPLVKNKLMTRKRKKSRHPLRDLRLQRGFTLEELANLTKLSPSYLSRLESGTRRLNADILDKLAHVLSCHPGALLPMDSHGSKFNMNLTRSSTDSFDPSTEGRIQFQFNAPDLPLYAVKLSQDKQDVGGKIELEAPTEWVSRPHELMGVPGAIAFQINDHLPGCRYRVGDRIFAHPTRPLSSKCSVLAITQDNTAYIGEFQGWSEQSGAVNYLNLHFPENSNTAEKDTLELSKESLKSVYRIIGLLEAV